MFNPFSMLGGLVTTTALCVAVSVGYQMDAFSVCLFTSLGWFAYGKLAFAMTFAQGYGVKKGVRMVLGMPLVIAVFIMAISSILSYFLWLAYQPSTLHPQTIANLRAFGWSMVSGVATAICHWYFWARKEYFYESEYNIRVQCMQRGDTLETAEATVADYRSRGIVQ